MAIFNVRPIQRHLTFYGLLNVGGALGILAIGAAAYLFARTLPETVINPVTLILLLALVVAIGLLIVVAQKLAVKAHMEAVAAYAKASGSPFYDQEKAASLGVTFGAAGHMQDARNQRIMDAVKGPDWLYYDFTYDLYQRSRNGDYKTQRVYYAIMSATLPRKLPHIFFDSLKARKRQFRLEFARSQIYKFEGDFNESFAVYMPDSYKVDSLSFISPEVMLALRAADDYDIEIIGDQVMLLGSLGDPKTQVPDMAAKLAAIKKELLDNIDTYRDDRLPYDQGRNMVAKAGSQLRGSSVSFWVSVITSAVAILFLLIRFILGFFQYP